MAQMTSPQQLFVHELQDMYYAENALTKVLPKLADEVSDAELSQAFKQHLDETRQHVDNLEKVFAGMGMDAKGEDCPGIDGIKEEHDTFMKEHDASKELVDMFVTGAAARTEHYEIAAYTGLVGMAQSLGETDAAGLLEENLKQEQKALEKVEKISERLLRESAS